MHRLAAISVVFLFVIGADVKAQSDSLQFTHRYTAGIYFNGGISSADLNQLNDVLTKSGFPGIHQNFTSFRLGVSLRPIKEKDTYTSASASLAIARGDQFASIKKMSDITMWGFDVNSCMDLIPSRKWLLYPYVGFGLNFASLTLYDSVYSSGSFASSTKSLSAPSEKSYHTAGLYLRVGAGIERRLRISYTDLFIGFNAGYRVGTGLHFRETYISYNDSPTVSLNGLEYCITFRMEIWSRRGFDKLDEKFMKGMK